MAKEIEDKIQLEYSSLHLTATFLSSQFQKTQAKLNYLNKRLEQEYTDELFQDFQQTVEELKNLEKKINWEKKQCATFDKKLKKLNTLKNLEFVSSLSKKILSKRRKP